MKYKIHRLDKRFSYCDHFQYYIGFTGKMSNEQGPFFFNRAQEWFTSTYGWSAEIRQWGDMLNFISTNQLLNRRGFATPNNVITQRPDACNPYWSWTNGYDDLRIYVASEKELAFFRLAHPLDQ